MIRRIIPTVVGLLLIISIGGVFAVWQYAGLPVASKWCDVDVNIEEFQFHAEDILPGGNDENIEVPIGGNHLVLIDLILNENEKGYGLNINDNVVLHRYLERQPVVFSNQKVSGGNLKFILDPQNNTHGLYYNIEKITDTLYYCYTFSTDALEAASLPAGEIEVYRTFLEIGFLFCLEFF